MKTKKGSMELGINAIVIIIIALAILGLGIAFVTNLFKGAGDNFGSIIENSKLTFHADSLTPIMFDKTTIKIKPKDKIQLVTSVYNDGRFGSSDVSLSLASCVDVAGNDVLTDFQSGAPSQSITAGADAGFAMIISSPDANGFPEGNYICKITASGNSAEVSGSIFIDVAN